MKIYIVLICVFVFHISGAQENASLPNGVQITSENIDVPDIVRNKFNREHPNVKPTWQIVGDNYVAEYIDETTETKRLIAFDDDSNVMRRDKEVDEKNYPKAIKNYFSKHYPNENYTIWYSEDNSGNKIYYSKQKSIIIWFDKDGKFLLTKNAELTGK
jgi:hypothetical protein